MKRQARRGAAWRLRAGAVLAGVVTVAPASAQTTGDPARAPMGTEPRRGPDVPWLAPGAPIVPPDLEASPPRLRLYRPGGSGAGPLQAAVLADVTGHLRVDGRAAYHPHAAMAVLDVEARAPAFADVSVSIRLVSRHHLPGRSLPLELRGREQRVAVGLRVPLAALRAALRTRFQNSF